VAILIIAENAATAVCSADSPSCLIFQQGVPNVRGKRPNSGPVRSFSMSSVNTPPRGSAFKQVHLLFALSASVASHFTSSHFVCVLLLDSLEG